MAVRFHKSGREIKAAVSRRLEQLLQRLDRRNAVLGEMMDDRSLVKAYLIRVGRPRMEQNDLRPASGAVAEQIEELRKLCDRVFALEREIHKLRIITAHLADNETFDLSYSELVTYGFGPDNDHAE